MNKNNVKELVKQFENENYKDLFGALIVFEKLDYIIEDDITDKDIEFLEKVYEEFMESKTISGLLNEELKDIIESESE